MLFLQRTFMNNLISNAQELSHNRMQYNLILHNILYISKYIITKNACFIPIYSNDAGMGRV